VVLLGVRLDVGHLVFKVKVLDKIKSAITTVARLFGSDKVQGALERAAALVPIALPIVQSIAWLTPTGADDEMVTLFARYGVPEIEKFLALPREDRGLALLKVATDLVARRAPGVPTHILNTAVQFAVVAEKNK
jgi:hypothetical protein